MTRWIPSFLIALVALTAAGQPAHAQRDRLAAVQERGYLRCGVNPGQMGISMANAAGEWIGMSADLCRALAAATLGDPDANEFVPVTAGNRFEALRNGQIDVLLRNTTWTFTRDVTQGTQFIGPFFVDEEKVMVSRDSGIEDLSQLHQRTVCVITGGPSEVIMNDLAFSANAQINLVPVGSAEQYRQAYLDGRCVGISDGQAALQAMRVSLPDPDQHFFIGERLAYSPLSIGVREGDDRWADIVRWTFYALATAEEYGVTQESVGNLMPDISNPALYRMLNPDSGAADAMGLEPDWARRAIQAAGNLQEIYDRAFGEGTVMAIPRGPSALWRDGGMILPPPF
ncbi:transporter substrate-binding domain-containing protein [Maricaulis parjimensis]|uniref:transporter substrate-binding domain-containing protein n=1 Tax=Maricaulis parjimensis TaxID=144023 RepID=UPI001939B92D|nr:transporter substrate-binding domain-containing protein [Maricaulis parjimensis]